MSEATRLTPHYTPGDLLESNAAWGANCGPGALAAILRVPVMGLKEHFPKPWTTPTNMVAALWALKVPAELLDGWQVVPRGLAFVQMRGKWDNAPVRVQYKNTHWIAFTHDAGGHFIYDVNAGKAGGWELAQTWKATTLRAMCGRRKGASGLWFIRHTIHLPTAR